MPITAKRRPDEPLFKKIKSDLLMQVASGKLSPGQRLQDERTLAREYKVSRDTIRRALEHLSEEQIIDRLQGNGTYIRAHSPAVQKIAAIFFGHEVPGEDYMLYVLSYLGRQAESKGAELVFRSYVSRVDLKAGLKALNEQPHLLGGIVLSPNTPEELETIRDLARFPLVLLGDMAAPDRIRVVINQVVGCNHGWGYATGRELVNRGCRRLATVMIDRYFVWTAEYVQGILDAARSLPESMKKVFVFQSDDRVDIRPPDPLAMIAWAENLVDGWLKSGWVPDGIFTQSPWLMRVLVQGFVKAGVSPSAMPIFAVRGDQGIGVSSGRPEVKVITVRLKQEGLIDRTIQRLREIRIGDTTRRIEILLQELVIDES